MKNKIDQIFRHIAEKHQLSHALESLEQDSALNKGDVGNLGRAAILATALGATGQLFHNKIKEVQEERGNRKLAQVIERPKTEQEKAYDGAKKESFTIAAKNMPLSRNLAKLALKENDSLGSKYEYLMNLSPKAFDEIVSKNPDIKKDIASHHYDKAHQYFNGDEDKIIESYRKGFREASKIK